jgi:tetratricopeptide (TPR) repeat protein
MATKIFATDQPNPAGIQEDSCCHIQEAGIDSTHTTLLFLMRRLPAFIAALLLPSTPTLLLGTAALTGALLASPAPAQAQTADDDLAQAKALLGKKGSEQQIIDLSNQALAKQKSAKAYYYRGFAKFSLGDKQGAISDFNQAIAINPQYADAYFNRGIARSALGDNQGAIADFNQAIAINPQDVTAYVNRGNAKFALGDKQGAIKDYTKAIAINPQYADAYSNRGNAKSALGDKQGALADYNKAIAINPNNADFYLNRGNVKYDLGDKEGACRDFKKAVSQGGDATTLSKWLQSENAAWCRTMS